MKSAVHTTAEGARRASRELASVNGERRSSAIRGIAAILRANVRQILSANQQDLADAAKLISSGEISSAVLQRLSLTGSKIADIASGMEAVAELPDPLGRVLQRTELDTGLVLDRVTCPLGVLAVIFEARPDAVTQISALALKSGNAVILKPGVEVERTAALLVSLIRQSLADAGFPPDAVTMVTGREAVHELLGMSELVDLVIPRGSKQLVEFIQSSTRIPVLGHAEGICHVYIDAAADPVMALDIVDDAKTDYPAACNAAETVLVHRDIAPQFLRSVAERFRNRVRLRGCERTRSLLPSAEVESVPEPEWHTEYGELVLAIRVVDNMDDAIEHIHRYGSGHTETIVTEDSAAAERFLGQVDAAGVYHNASTRFADGYRYGFGAEVGISTSKLHARGPVGLDGLTTYKYLLRGKGHLAGDYQGEHGRKFRHLPLRVDNNLK